MREAVPINWIKDYLNRLKGLDVAYDDSNLSLDEIVKDEFLTMLNEYDIEEQIAEKNKEDYVLCTRKVEVIGKMPNGYTITKESYVPVEVDG